jgi:alanine dehydrogenase
MSPLTLGVLARTRKENEQRLPIHPLHLDRIDADVAQRVFLETGYGEDFGIADDELTRHVGGVRSRADLIAECDVVLLLKPDPADLVELREGQVLWGWPHCVQDRELTQQAIDRRQTLIAFEAMNLWGSDGSFKLHVFHKNNELAGYSSVQHALQLIGSTGMYGRRLRAVVLGFGATGRGAVTGLAALGVNDIDILTNRPVVEVASPIHSADIRQFDGEAGMVQTEDGDVPLVPFLAEHDVVVNCVLQDPNSPLVFLTEDDLAAFRPGSLLVDVSCDEGMAFSWARPTTFTEPTFTVGDNITYYAVDHSPSYLWNAATWEISEALLPYLAQVLDGPQAWAGDPTLKRAIEIQDGRVLNADILAFQDRAPEYPHGSSASTQ